MIHYLVLLVPTASLLAMASPVPAAAQFRYDPDGPPLVYYTPRQTWPQAIIRHTHGRYVTVPAWSAEASPHWDEPPPPASQYSLSN